MRATAAAVLLLLLTFPPPSATAAAASAADETCDSKNKNINNNGAGDISFGVDVSYPIHRLTVSSNYDSLPHNSNINNKKDGSDFDAVPDEYKGQPIQPLGDKQRFYDELMSGCMASCDECADLCQETESERVEMNRRQPQSMRNYTDTGIKKIRAPESLMKLLTEFWANNQGRESVEDWPEGNTYVNHWEMLSYMLSVEDDTLKGGGADLREKLWDSAVSTISEWTGQDLTTSSLYGIRIYKDGAVLAPHVDRMPLVSSAIINVAQDVDEPWPIEVITHDGKARNITMEPGDMVLYESHSVVHGRPYPLKGRYYANVFIHFQPTYEDPDSLPSYVLPDSPEAKRWERERRHQTIEPTEAHRRAAVGDLAWLRKVDAKAESNNDETADGILFREDGNGWTPLHEASRAGHTDVVRFLLEVGADPNHRTEGGEGQTPLEVALEELEDENHPAIKLLEGKNSDATFASSDSRTKGVHAADDDGGNDFRARERQVVDYCRSEVLLFNGIPRVSPDGSIRAEGQETTSLKDDDQPVFYDKVSRFSDEFDGLSKAILQVVDGTRILHVSANGDHMGWFVYVPSDECLQDAKSLVAREIVASLGNSVPDRVKQIDRRGPHRLVDEEGKDYPDQTDSSRLHLLLPREAFVHESVEEGFVRTLMDGTTLQTLSMSPRAFLVDPMLSVDDCDDLIDSSSKKFRRSGEKHYSPGYENYRTSLTGQTPRSDAALRLWRKTKAITGMPEGGVEFPQLLKYETHTSWYKPHMDYFHSWTDKPLEDARMFVKTRAQEVIRLEVPELIPFLKDESSFDPGRTMKPAIGVRLVDDLALARPGGVDGRRIVHDFLRNSQDPVEDFRQVAIHLAAYILEANGASSKALSLARSFFRFDDPNHTSSNDYVPYFLKPVEFNRHATVLPILRHAEQGGHTAFPGSTSKLGVKPDIGEEIEECKRGLIVRPETGQALLFYNRLPRGELDPASQHAGCSVQVGEKFACNCFTWDSDQTFAYLFQTELDDLYSSS